PASRPVLPLLKTVAYVLGSMLMYIGGAMVISAVVSLIHGETETAAWIGVSAVITSGFGFATRRLVPKPSRITIKQGFATVGLAWFVFSLFGALPYLLTGAIPDFTNAVFETTSGFTTTGATVIDPADLPHGLIF